MLISPIKQKLIGTLPKALLLGGFALIGYCQYNSATKFDEKESQAKEYVKKNDINKYNELVERKGWPKDFYWVVEAQKLETKLKNDSIAKTNYALGLQAVRDSLANTSKNNK